MVGQLATIQPRKNIRKVTSPSPTSDETRKRHRGVADHGTARNEVDQRQTTVEELEED